jgi:NAD(P)H-dependent FMN reductase
MSLSIGVILASTRPQRAGEGVAKWFIKQAEQNSGGMNFTLIDLKEVNLPFLDESVPAMMNQYQNEHTKKWAATIDRFDGFVVVTPEYNHSVPAALKNAFDFLYKEWNRKPIAFVAYGADAGGARAVEHLRSIVVQLQMAPISDQILIPSIWSAMEDGKVKAGSLIGDMPRLLHNLEWWAVALKTAREKS